MMARLGWKAGTEQYPPDFLLECAIAAEAAGFDALEASDHFHPWAEVGQCAFTWTWLGAVAARTSRIEIGTGVTCPTLRYHPSVIAQAAATVAVMAPGRMMLGVGTGEALNEYAAVGDWPSYAERQGRLAEAIKLMRELWTGEAISFRGDYYSTERARLYTRPDQPIPVVVSSLHPGSAAFAGRQGDGLITVGGKKSEHYQELLQNFQVGLRASGKANSPIRCAVELNVAYTDDVDAAVKELKKYWAGSYIPALFNEKIYTPALSEQNGEVVGRDTICSTSCISPDPDAHVEFVKQYLDLGFDTIYFHCAGPDQLGFLERYGRDVLPRLRAGAGQ